jgi:peptide/nickel transport system permease protein
MAAFLARRVLSGLLLVGTLVFLTFFVFNEIPTTPACLVVACGPKTTTTDAMIRDAEHQLGIDRSVFVQFGDYVWKLVTRGDFGTAWTSHINVGTQIGQSLPVTASLVGGGMILMMLLALPLGCIAALRPSSPVDRGLLALSVIGLAIHPFVLGLTIRDFYATHFHIYSGYCPLTGAGPPTIIGPGQTAPGCGGLADWAGHLLVPWTVFALFFLPLYMRMLRVRLVETFSEPWINTARAKGASETRVVLGHALRNAIGPVLPMLAVDAGTAITAAIYVELVFGMPGLGSLAVGALSGRAGGYDLPLVAGVVTVIGAFVVLLNFAADLAGAWLDPRIRTKTASGLIPLPRSVASHPRARLGLNLAAGVVLAAVLGVVLTHRAPATTGRFDLGTPIKAVHVNWTDQKRLEQQMGSVTERGYLVTHVTEIQFGRYGWQVHASVTNKSALPIRLFSINAPSGMTLFYPQQPMSLLVQTDNGGGRYLKPLPARVFTPAFPDVLKPHATWTGTFSGPDPVKSGSDFYVGFGQFTYANPSTFNQVFSTSTSQSAKAP